MSAAYDRAGYGAGLFPQHADMLGESGITPEHARARGYVSVDTKKRLEGLNITRAGRNVPGLLVPQLRADGSTWGHQYRPDSPRLRDGRPVKYETPVGQRNGLDVPPGVGKLLDDPDVPLWVTEGVKKADAAALAGLCCVALPGVWSWRGTNDRGGRTAVPDWHDVALNGRRVVLAFDSDVAVKPAVRRALDELAGYLATKGAAVEYLHLPDHGDGKTGLDDFLAARSAEELRRLVRPHPPAVVETAPATTPGVPVLHEVAAHDVSVGEPAALLDEVEGFLGRFVAFPTEAARVAVTLWAAHAHAVDAFDSSPRLALLSPEPGSGKTRTLEVLDLLVPKPMHVLNASVAVTFRAVDKNQPTLLLDEVDAIFGRRTKDENEELRGLLNAGHRRGAQVPRCVGPNHELQLFNVFAACALAGLGDLPDTLMSRSVVVRMRRRGPGESVEPYRQRVHEAEGHAIRDRLASWVAALVDNLRDAWPDLPAGVEDRPADVWEPLLAIAEAAGGSWPERARAACVELVKVAASGEASLGVRLLGDLRMILGDAVALHTETILGRLRQLDESPWPDLRGRPLDARRLAHLLGGYEVRSTKVNVNGHSLQGYRREHLYDAWIRYLPPQVPQEAEPTEPAERRRSEGLFEVPSAKKVPEPATRTEPAGTALTCTVPEVPEVPERGEAVPDIGVLACPDCGAQWVARLGAAWHVCQPRTADARC